MFVYVYNQMLGVRVITTMGTNRHKSLYIDIRNPDDPAIFQFMLSHVVITTVGIFVRFPCPWSVAVLMAARILTRSIKDVPSQRRVVLL